MKQPENDIRISAAKKLALVGVMAATIECGKLALSFLPNIEVVTLLCALYGYVFGWYGVAAAAVFVCIEPLIYGFGSWVITYALYWPAVAVVFMLFGRIGLKNRWLLSASAVGMTVIFGIGSATIDTAFYLGINENYFANLIVYYIRGSVFYAVQIACNAAIFLTVFLYLSDKLSYIRRLIGAKYVK